MKRGFDEIATICDYPNTKSQKSVSRINTTKLFSSIEGEKLTVDNLNMYLTKVGNEVMKSAKSKQIDKQFDTIMKTLMELSYVQKSLCSILGIDPSIQMMSAIVKSNFNREDIDDVFQKMNDICMFPNQEFTKCSHIESVIKKMVFTYQFIMSQRYKFVQDLLQ